MKPKVVITNWVHPEVIELLEPHCEVIANHSKESLSREEVLERAKYAEALMVFMPERLFRYTGSKKTCLLVPKPTIIPFSTLKLTFSNAFIPVSGYVNVTFRNSISPLKVKSP